MINEADVDLWDRSAEAWIEFVNQDLNRVRILDPVVLEMCGPLWGKSVIDVGCGEGRFSRKIATRGGNVIGIDPVKTFLVEARKLDPLGDYISGQAESLPVPDETYDFAVYYLTLCDIEDLEAAAKEAVRVVKAGGQVIVADLHPIMGRGNWTPEGYLVGDYILPSAAVYEWKGIRVKNYHRPFQAWFKAFTGAGFVLADLVEPTATSDLAAESPGQLPHTTVPNFVVMRWQKESL